jgi:hypothetical protein
MQFKETKKLSLKIKEKQLGSRKKQSLKIRKTKLGRRFIIHLNNSCLPVN